MTSVFLLLLVTGASEWAEMAQSFQARREGMLDPHGPFPEPCVLKRASLVPAAPSKNTPLRCVQLHSTNAQLDADLEANTHVGLKRSSCPGRRAKHLQLQQLQQSYQLRHVQLKPLLIQQPRFTAWFTIKHRKSHKPTSDLQAYSHFFKL